LNKFKLSEEPVRVYGTFTEAAAPSAVASLLLDETSFATPGPAVGTLYNFNTMEGFTRANKRELFEAAAARLQASVRAGDSAAFVPFILVTFANLKTHQFHYYMAIMATDLAGVTEELVAENGQRSLAPFSLPSPEPSFFGLASDSPTTADEVLTLSVADSPVLGMVDSTARQDAFSWPLRTLLASARLAGRTGRLSVLVTRGARAGGPQLLTFAPVDADAVAQAKFKAYGWVRTNNKVKERVVNAAEFMDPRMLVASAADLNLSLMRWRAAPSLDLAALRDMRCLLVGAGTLGCAVARNLMSWGVRHITFVDSGVVSPSNPVRQSLYTVDDIGKPKAEAAAAAVRNILPDVESRGVRLAVPMPGHPGPQEDDYVRLRQEVENADVVFLLTDSREARWLGTALCATVGRLCITAGLGFDTYVVMRHGVPGDGDGVQVGCYFCNDVVAPRNSTTDRSLDRQCTVTRPGVSALASGYAVELAVATFLHPHGARAVPANSHHFGTVGKADAADADADLGTLPHQLRGFLSTYSLLLLDSPPYPACTACSGAVGQKLNEEGFAFVDAVASDPSVLEQVVAAHGVGTAGEVDAEEWDMGSDDDF